MPSFCEMEKVDMDGMSTMFTPDITPGRLSGHMTRRSTPALLQPRSRAASIRRTSIFAMTEYIGSIIYGK